MTYQAPVDDIVFSLKTVAALGEMDTSGLYPGLDADTVIAVIEEAGKFGAEVLAPLNAVGDRIGSKLTDGKVMTPPGFS
ncbi:MAG: acyl-CoA dehydrogenase, partial [Hyphomicrobium sp.]|nr:acyl-CoA dehydrogenase [Hyphomicrobium sp.]